MIVEQFVWSQPQPRIVQHQGRRYALRLENIFWQQLEKLARRRRMRLGQLVAELTAASEGPNVSSYIRGFCMVESARDNARYRLGAGSFDLLDILHSSPAPALLLDQFKQIVDANQALQDWAGTGQTPPVLRQENFESLFRARATRSLDDTLALMRAGQIRRTQLQMAYTPKTGEAPRTVLATFTGLPVGNIFYALVWLTPVAPVRLVPR